MQKDFIVKNISSVTLDPTHSQVPYAVHNITKTIIETKDGRNVIVDGGYLDTGLIDTMKDLLVNFLGAIVCSVLGYLYVKTRDKNSIVGRYSSVRESCLRRLADYTGVIPCDTRRNIDI